MKYRIDPSTLPPGTTPGMRVESVARACQILRAFRTTGDILELRHIAERTELNKVTVLRILRTLEAEGVVKRVGTRGYHSLFQPLGASRLRIGYAAQSARIPFNRTVTESIAAAARSADIDLLTLDNGASRKLALENADRFIRERVDLVMEFQLFSDIAATLSARFAAAGIPTIAIDNPHPGAIYFGADNYRAGSMAGAHLGRWAATRWHGVVDEVVLLQNPVGGPILESRMLGVVDGLAMTLPHTQDKPRFRYDAGGYFDNALSVMRKHLRTDRSNRILVAAINDPTALGALQAFREAGAEERCAIVGQDAVMEARHEMRRLGTRLVGSVAYFPETYGERLMRVARDVLNRGPLLATVLTRHRLVTPANVNKIYANDLLLPNSAAGVQQFQSTL